MFRMHALFTLALAWAATATLSPARAETETAPAPEETRGWTVWVSLGGYITSDPTACTAGNWTYVVARGGDNFFYFRRRYLPTGIWDDWRRIPGKAFSGAPAVRCSVNDDGRSMIEVQAIGFDGRLWRNYNSLTDVDVWSGWQRDTPFAARVGSAPAFAQFDRPYLRHILVKGQDGYLYDEYQSPGGSWSAWRNLGAAISYDPAAVMQAAGHLDVVYATARGLMHRFWENGIWYAPVPVPGSQYVYSSPEVISRGPGSMDLFVRGGGNTLLHASWTNAGWGAWENLGGAITSGPGAATYASNARMMVFARWSDGSLYYRAWAP